MREKTKPQEGLTATAVRGRDLAEGDELVWNGSITQLQKLKARHRGEHGSLSAWDIDPPVRERRLLMAREDNLYWRINP